MLDSIITALACANRIYTVTQDTENYEYDEFCEEYEFIEENPDWFKVESITARRSVVYVEVTAKNYEVYEKMRDR